MTRRRLYAAICLVASVFTVDLTACGPRGPSQRGLADPTRHDPLAEDYWKLDRVSYGTKLTVTTRESGKVVGRYDGFLHVSDVGYAAHYAAWLADSAAPTPRFPLGEPVRIVRKGSAPDSGAFAGFDFGVARYRRLNESRVRLALFGDLRRVSDSTGAAVTGDTLAAWLEAGRLPLGTSLRLGGERGERVIPLERVAALHAHGIPVGVTVAIAATFIVVLIVAYTNRPQPRPTSSGCSPGYAGGFYVLGTPALSP